MFSHIILRRCQSRSDLHLNLQVGFIEMHEIMHSINFLLMVVLRNFLTGHTIYIEIASQAFDVSPPHFSFQIFCRDNFGFKQWKIGQLCFVELIVNVLKLASSCMCTRNSVFFFPCQQIMEKFWSFHVSFCEIVNPFGIGQDNKTPAANSHRTENSIIETNLIKSTVLLKKYYFLALLPLACICCK